MKTVSKPTLDKRKGADSRFEDNLRSLKLYQTALTYALKDSP